MFTYVFMTLSILQPQSTEKGFKKASNFEQNVVLLLFLFTLDKNNLLFTTTVQVVVLACQLKCNAKLCHMENYAIMENYVIMGEICHNGKIYAKMETYAILKNDAINEKLCHNGKLCQSTKSRQVPGTLAGTKANVLKEFQSRNLHRFKWNKI